ncbi:glycosyltransferase family 2 protein [Clavulina sp. PMI_390]|nr:glycosyltransferase family 2 protein [Clavulina sp. PMI_390]
MSQNPPPGPPPPLPHVSYADPFHDGQQRQESSYPPSTVGSSSNLNLPALVSRPSYSLSDTSLPSKDYGHEEEHDATEPDAYDESQPLTARQGPGVSYPPSSVDPSAYGDPYALRGGVESSDAAWARRQTIRRGKTQRIKLTNGNFINEYPVPEPVWSAVEQKWRGATPGTEFTHMRYTAATCDPDDFTRENGWSLRASNYGRPTDLLVAVTSYNEDKILYARTLHGVMLNIRDIVKNKSSRYWKKTTEDGIPGWQRITVALICDGLAPMDKDVLDLFATVGVYQDGIMKSKVDEKDTVAHIFEYTTQLSVDATPTLVIPHGDDPNNLVPVQLILVIKQKNQKKINSHRWLFNAIGRHLQPEICVLIDAGTKPGAKSIYYLWEAFYNDKNLAGACGEIHAMIKGGKKLLNPLVAAQNFEYKMSNILDKPLESSFGYVSVLPGAFSAYRFKALQGRPLEQYFHGDHSLADRLGKKGVYGMSIFRANMYLAEDRILCFELVAKQGDQWTLSYVKPSKAETDVPEAAAELIGQRRRWLNGSFAASVYSLWHFFRFYKSGHNPIRMFFFHIQALYNIISLIFSWFALANIWLTFDIVISFLPKQDPPIYLFGTNTITTWVNDSFKWIYLGVLALQFVLALGNRPKGERFAYLATLCIFAFLSLYLIVCSFWLTVKAFQSLSLSGKTTIAAKLGYLLSGTSGTLLAALAATFGIYLFSSILYADPWHIVTSMPQYLLLAMSFTNVLNVYAFCNLHDVSWGTKGSDKAEVLPQVNSKKKGGDAHGVVEDTIRNAEDLEKTFKKTVDRATSKPVKVVTVEELTHDDKNKTFRTRLVAIWMLSNATLAMTIETLNGVTSGNEAKDDQALQAKQHTYFSIILWSTFGLALVRFTGCVYYWVKRNLFLWCRRN